MVKLADVARVAGVGYGTASRAISGRGSVDEATRTRVLDVAKELGYRRHAAARALRENRSHTVGLVVPDIVNEFYTETAEVITRELEREGLRLMVVTTGSDVAAERAAIDTMLERQVDAIIHVPVDPTAASIREVPLVQLNRRTHDATSAVLSDDVAGVRAVVEHVLDAGYRDLLVIGGPPGLSSSEGRIEGLRAAVACADAGRAPVRVREVAGAFSAESGARAFADALDDRPDVVVALSSRLVLGVLQAARQHDISVPGDIALAGYGDPDWFSVWGPGITTFSPPLAGMGHRAAALVVELLAGGEETGIELLPGSLEIRGTTPRR